MVALEAGQVAKVVEWLGDSGFLPRLQRPQHDVGCPGEAYSPPAAGRSYPGLHHGNRKAGLPRRKRREPNRKPAEHALHPRCEVESVQPSEVEKGSQSTATS